MKNDSIAIGIIGAGIMGERLLNAILQQNPGAAACLRHLGSGARCDAAYGKRPFLRCHAWPMHLPSLWRVNCTYIGSPPASHLQHARAALAAGKSVFSEKPLAVDVADARAFVAEAGNRGAVNFPFTSSLAVSTIRSWIENGEIGNPRRIAIEVGSPVAALLAGGCGGLAGQADAGRLHVRLSLHFLFLSRRLIGPLHGLSGKASFPEAGKSERRVTATLHAGDLPVRLAGAVGETAKDDHNIRMLQGDEGAVRLCDWSVAQRRMTDGASARGRRPCPRSRPGRWP